MSETTIVNYLKNVADQEIAEHSQRFFKTAEGEYGYGDIFLGIRVPVIRLAVKQFKETPLDIVEELLCSKYHEIRLFALLLLVHKFERGEEEDKEKIYQLYLNSTQYVNNWDLVDSSAHYIVGPYLFDKDRTLLQQLATSKSLWERRIAIMATFHFIKKNQFNDTLLISKILLNDKEDLIHKAVGWMLREIGKRDKEIEVRFLNEHYKRMPRTMLRYAIEKFDNKERDLYLHDKI